MGKRVRGIGFRLQEIEQSPERPAQCTECTVYSVQQISYAVNSVQQIKYAVSSVQQISYVIASVQQISYAVTADKLCSLQQKSYEVYSRYVMQFTADKLCSLQQISYAVNTLNNFPFDRAPDWILTRAMPS